MDTSNDLKGMMVVISGPSGVGKGTVISHLKKNYDKFEYPLSHTTRKMRKGEKEGEVYHFISKEEFQWGIDNGDFLEWACVHGDNYYGTLKKPILQALEDGKVVIREVDVQGAKSMKKVLPPENLLTIFLRAEDEDILMNRIAKRGELPDDEVKRRMASAKKEMKFADEFDYRVWSLEDQIPKCVTEVEKIIMDEIENAGIDF